MTLFNLNPPVQHGWSWLKAFSAKILNTGLVRPKLSVFHAQKRAHEVLGTF